MSVSNRIAIVGLSGRFPGAANADELWDNLLAGAESIRFFSREELAAAGVAAEHIASRGYVPAKGVVDGADRFDPVAFGLSESDAALMDPQFRLFLEIAWEALENAGYAAGDGHRTGVFAGANANTYHEYLRAHVDPARATHAMLLNQGDFLSAWTSYALNLTGPSVTVQSACSTSLAAVHLAGQSLLNGECDLALAGGVSLSFPQHAGYQYVDGGLLSPDGRCRAFDAAAQGFVPGEGVGAVVLKRLDEAIADGDEVRAVVAGSAMTNDGAHKIGFTAPSQAGMAAAIAESLATAEIPCDTIRMIEAHGAATVLGDPVEVAALAQVFRAHTTRRQFCALGSIKPNVGHTNAAAGIASLLKAVLAVQYGVIPPHRYTGNPNPTMRLAETPFYLPAAAEPWPADAAPRRAGVNAFGIGGTNVHVTLEEAPPRETRAPSDDEQLLVLSARTASALEALTDALAAWLERRPGLSLGDVAFTLAAGRRPLEHRRALQCRSVAEAVQILRARDAARMWTRRDESDPRTLTFLFPDRMDASLLRAASELHASDAAFRAAIDRCTGRASARMPGDAQDMLDILAIGRSGHDGLDPARSRRLTVATEYALAMTLIARGVRPGALVADGAGELAAACVAGVLPPETAIRLAALEPGDRPGVLESALPSGVATIAFLPASRGEWIAPGTAVGEPLRAVRASHAALADAIDRVLQRSEQALVDLSSGQALALVRGGPAAHPDQVLVAAMPPDGAAPPDRWLLQTIATLWLANVPVDWTRFHADANRRRVVLPSYPFERRRYWVGEAAGDERAAAAGASQSIGRHPPFREPANDLEAVIASIWAFHIGTDRVSTDERFIDAGGNSILAMRIITTLRETLQVDLPLRALLENPTIAALAEAVARAADEWEIDVHQIARTVREIQQMTGGPAAGGAPPDEVLTPAPRA